MPMQTEYKLLGLSPHPFVTYTLKPHYRSELVCTDSFGFRQNYGSDGVPLDLRTVRSRYSACRLLLGGSVAFGIGASSDRTTMAALLTTPERPFINLGISAAACQQELAYYLALRHLLPEVTDVVLFTGFNEAVHAGLREAEVHPEFGGTVLGEMRMPPPPPNPLTRFVRKVRSAVNGVVGAAPAAAEEWARTEVEDNLLPPELVDMRLRATLDRTVQTMKIWRILQDALDMRVHYVLQPSIGWTTKRLTELEQSRWEEDQVQLGKAVRWLATEVVHQRLRDELETGAKEAGIRFYDANDWLADGYDDTTIFIDVAHFEDAGQQIVADELERRLDWR